MDFALNEEQKTFQATARQYIESKGGLDIARRYIEGEEHVLEDLWTGLGDLGYLGVNISEQYGGLGMGPLTLVPILEELGRAVVPGPYAETMSFAVPMLETYGTEKQKRKYLPDIAKGKRKFSLAILEEDALLEPHAIQLKALPTTQGYFLSGTKCIVPNADVADTFIVLVRTGGGNSEYGLSLVLLDRDQLDADIEPLQSMDETRKVANLTINELRIEKEQLLGAENVGWGILQEGLVHLQAALCSSMVGGIEKTVDMATDYGKMRTQFGQPIGRFQAVKHRIVDMKLILESSRSLAYYAAWAVENQADEMLEAVALAKSFIPEGYIQTASDNIQVHGGMGFTWEFDCHLFLKRARALENYLGSPEYYREIIAVELGW